MTAGVDAMGGPTETASTLATVWASKRDLSGKEWFAAQQINTEITTVFTIRYRSDVTLKHSILYGSTTYNIHAIKELGREEGLEIMAGALNG